MKGVPVMWIPLRGMMNEPQQPGAVEFERAATSKESADRRDNDRSDSHG